MFGRLRDLDFFKKTDQQVIHYSENHEEGAEIDFSRLFKQDKFYWKTVRTKKAESLEKKTLIVTDHSLANKMNITEFSSKTMSNLSALYFVGFEIYILQADKLKKVRCLNDIYDLVRTIPADADKLLQFIDQENLTFDHVKLISKDEIAQLSNYLYPKNITPLLINDNYVKNLRQTNFEKINVVAQSKSSLSFIIEMIKSSPNLKRFWLKVEFPFKEDEDGNELIQALSTCTQLEELNSCHVPIGKSSTLRFKETASFRHLRELKLEECDFFNNSFLALLKSIPNLQELILSSTFPREMLGRQHLTLPKLSILMIKIKKNQSGKSLHAVDEVNAILQAACNLKFFDLSGSISNNSFFIKSATMEVLRIANSNTAQSEDFDFSLDLLPALTVLQLWGTVRVNLKKPLVSLKHLELVGVELEKAVSLLRSPLEYLLIENCFYEDELIIDCPTLKTLNLFSSELADRLVIASGSNVETLVWWSDTHNLYHIIQMLPVLNSLILSESDLNVTLLETIKIANDHIQSFSFIKGSLFGNVEHTSPLWSSNSSITIDDSALTHKVVSDLKEMIKAKCDVDIKMNSVRSLTKEEDIVSLSIEKSVIAIDTDTDTDANAHHIYKGVQTYFTNHHPDYVPGPENYRLRIIERLSIDDEGRVTEVDHRPEFSENTAWQPVAINVDITKQYDDEYSAASDIHLARYKLFLRPGSIEKVHDLACGVTMIAMSTDVPILRRFDETVNAWYIMLAEGQTHSKNILIQYIFQENTETLTLSGSTEEDLKLLQLINYFKAFTLERVSGLSADTSDCDKLGALLRQQKGSCRHRVWSALFIRDEFPVTIFGIANRCHCYIQVKYHDKWFKVDLGGSPIQVEMLPMLPTKKSPALEPEQENNPFLNAFSIPPDWQISDMFDAILANHQPFPNNVLMIFDHPDFIFSLQKFIHSTLKKSGYDCLFLPNLDLLKLQQSTINNGEPVLTESFFLKFNRTVDSLALLITDWSEFFEDRHIGLNSIIGDRLLNGQTINDNILQVNLLHRSRVNHMREDFYSRHQVIFEVGNLGANYSWSQFEEAKEVDTDESVDVETIVLQGAFDWENKLLGSVNVQNNRITEIKGALIRAAERQLKGIKIVNPQLQSNEFKLLISSIHAEGKFNYSGKEYTLVEGFEIRFENRAITHVLKYTPMNNIENAFFLNEETANYLLSPYQFKAVEGGYMPNAEPGLLEVYKNKTLLIYCNDALSQEAWIKIIELQEKFAVTLCIAFGPEFRMAAGIKTSSPVTILSSQPHANTQLTVISTNDIDFVTDKLCSEGYAKPIRVSENTTLSSLFGDFKAAGQLCDLLFTHTVGRLAQALDSGCPHIIIRGEFSFALLKQLASLSISSPYLLVHGRIIQLPKNIKISIVTELPNPFGLLVKTDVRDISSDDMLVFLNKQGVHRDVLVTLCQYMQFNKLSYIQYKNLIIDIANRLSKNPLTKFSFLRANKADKEQENLPTAAFIAKRRAKIEKRLRDFPYVFILGETAFISALFTNDIVFEGYDHVIDWIASTQSGRKILIINNATLLNTQQLDHLETLFDPDPGLDIDGKFYPLTSRHYMVCADDAVNEQSANLHPFFKRHGNIIHFEDFHANFLLDKIIYPILAVESSASINDNRQIIAEYLLEIYFYIKKMSTQYKISVRDLRMLCLYYIHIAHVEKSDQITILLNKAVGRWAAHLPNNQTLFVSLYQAYGVLPPPIVNVAFPGTNYVVTESRQALFNVFDDIITLRNYLLTTTLAGKSLPGILLEGPSGVGKSEAVNVFLRSKNISYDKLKLGDNQTMLANIHQSSRSYYDLLVDEVNTLGLEKDLIKFMHDNDEDPKLQKNDGFVFWATQNPSSFPGRKTLPANLLNSFVTLTVPDYSVTELNTILVAKGVDPETSMRLSQFYCDAKAKQSLFLTPRTLFGYTDRYLKKRASSITNSLHKNFIL